jgi:hypothetical protein
MQVEIYDLKNTPDGKKQGDTFLAQVELTDEGVRIETYDKKLKEKLGEIFSSQLTKRVALGNVASLITHYYEAVPTFTEEHFEEILFTLHKHNLFGIIHR